jgi:hypothetical protein
MPDNAVPDLLSFPCSAGFTEVVILSGRVDLPDHATAGASLHSVIIAEFWITSTPQHERKHH